MAAPIDDSIDEPSKNSLLPIGEGVIIDIGTGDGLFVYQSARLNPKKFYIGIDANPRPLEKISERIHRRPSKGGASNVLFIQSAIEELPAELDGIADEVHIHFPWGSLLQAVAVGDRPVLENLQRICSHGALLEVIFAVDPDRDSSEMKRLNLPPLSMVYLDSVLVPKYATAGFQVIAKGIIAASGWPELKSSWAKRLKGNSKRPLLYLIAEAVKINSDGKG